MTEGIEDTRFLFWRILVALAHQDHQVTHEERDFIISKFGYLPFSKEQEAQLKTELEEPQNAMALFDQLKNNEQRAECIYMAHNLFASDDDYHPIERAMYDRMKTKHMAGLDITSIEEEFKEFRTFQDERNKQFESFIVEYRDEFDFLSGWTRSKQWKETSEDYFVVWRFLISLIHVDNKITPEERQLVQQRVESLNVNEKHRQQLLREINQPQNPVALFDDIRTPMRRAECLYIAHVIFDSDMDYSPIEKELYARLAETDDDRTTLRDVYRKIDRREREKEDRSPIVKALQWLDDAMD